MALAFFALVFAPVTVSVPIGTIEVLELAIGLVVLLVVDLFLLRPAFAPLDQLAETMRRHDPLSPGPRAEVRGGPVVAGLAQTFNDMLDRLESERRESARRALLVQENERRRIARELHDEVGQTLTGVMLQIEGLAPSIPDELRGQLDELRETARHGTEEVRRLARRLRPDALDELGLSSALAALTSAFERQTRVPVVRRLASGLRVSPEVTAMTSIPLNDRTPTNHAIHTPPNPWGMKPPGSPVRLWNPVAGLPRPKIMLVPRMMNSTMATTLIMANQYSIEPKL